MKPPIFIVGANRSGTTLLRLILNAHSNIAIPEELQYLQSRPAGIPIEQWRNPGIDKDRYFRYVTRTLKQREAMLPGLDIDALRDEILQTGQGDFRTPYVVMLENWMRLQGKKRFGEKTPGNLFYADILQEWFPGAKFIYVVRDPRAGVSSMMETSFFPGDLVFNAMSRRKFATEGRNRLERAVPTDQRVTIRFEDLVNKPEETVKALCEFIEEEFEPEMLRFHKNASKFMSPQASSDFNAAATRPIAPQIAEKWRQKLNRHQIAIIEHICAGEMQEFGYEPNGYPLRLRDRAEIMVKTLYWNVQCWRMRKARHYIIRYKMFSGLRNRSKKFLRALAKPTTTFGYEPSSK